MTDHGPDPQYLTEDPMFVPSLRFLWFSLIMTGLYGCDSPREDRTAKPEVTMLTVQPQSVTVKQLYVCELASHHHIKVIAPETGNLTVVKVRDGAEVKQGDVLYEMTLPEIKDRPENEAKIIIKASFGGLVGRSAFHEGSLVQKGEELTTLSDNSIMWAYFNVPETRYLSYKEANLEHHMDDLKVELVLANGKTFDQPGKVAAIGTHFHETTGTVAFRADFPNPDHLLRQGQSGTIVLGNVQENAIVIPQSATLQIHGKRYIYLVDDHDFARRHEIVVQSEQEDGFVIKSGLKTGDRIIVSDLHPVQDGMRVTETGGASTLPAQ